MADLKHNINLNVEQFGDPVPRKFSAMTCESMLNFLDEETCLDPSDFAERNHSFGNPISENSLGSSSSEDYSMGFNSTGIFRNELDEYGLGPLSPNVITSYKQEDLNESLTTSSCDVSLLMSSHDGYISNDGDFQSILDMDMSEVINMPNGNSTILPPVMTKEETEDCNTDYNNMDYNHNQFTNFIPFNDYYNIDNIYTNDPVLQHYPLPNFGLQDPNIPTQDLTYFQPSDNNNNEYIPYVGDASHYNSTAMDYPYSSTYDTQFPVLDQTYPNNFMDLGHTNDNLAIPDSGNLIDYGSSQTPQMESEIPLQTIVNDVVPCDNVETVEVDVEVEVVTMKPNPSLLQDSCTAEEPLPLTCKSPARENKRKQAFMFRSGDRVRFQPISVVTDEVNGRYAETYADENAENVDAIYGRTKKKGPAGAASKGQTYRKNKKGDTLLTRLPLQENGSKRKNEEATSAYVSYDNQILVIKRPMVAPLQERIMNTAEEYARRHVPFEAGICPICRKKFVCATYAVLHMKNCLTCKEENNHNENNNDIDNNNNIMNIDNANNNNNDNNNYINIDNNYDTINIDNNNNNIFKIEEGNETEFENYVDALIEDKRIVNYDDIEIMDIKNYEIINSVNNEICNVFDVSY